MEAGKGQVLVMVPLEEWQQLHLMIREIWQQIKERPVGSEKGGIKSPYITAKEFMTAVRICRSNFDKLVNGHKIMTLKKGRKVYVVATEVERYFREVEV